MINLLGDDTCFSSENIRAIAYNQKIANTSVGALWELVEPVLKKSCVDTNSIDSGFYSSATSIDNLVKAPFDLLNELKSKSTKITNKSKSIRNVKRAKKIQFLDDFSKRDATLTLIKITGMTTEKINSDFFIKYLHDFIKKNDIAWSSINKNNEERLFDHNARRDFDRNTLINQLLNSLSSAEKEKLLENMEGEFGERLRGVVEFAAEKVGQNEEDLVMISTVYKYSTLMEDLIVTLRNQLGKEEVRIDNPEYIRQFSQLTTAEIQTLSKVGITRDLLIDILPVR